MSRVSAVHSSEGEEEQQRRIHFVESSTTPNLSRRRVVVRCLILTLILLLLAISVCTIIVWLVLYPRVPVIQINSFSVSNFSLLHGNVRADAEMGFTVRNKNWKKSLWFARFNISLWYKNHVISESHFEPFELTKKNETSKNVKFAVKGFDGKEESAAVDMIRKELSFSVSLKGYVFFPSGKSYSKKKSIETFCRDLKVEFSTNGTGKLNSDQKHDCSVHFV